MGTSPSFFQSLYKITFKHCNLILQLKNHKLGLNKKKTLAICGCCSRGRLKYEKYHFVGLKQGACVRILGLAKPKLGAIFLLINITSYMHICQRIGEVWCRFKELSNIGSDFLLIHPMLWNGVRIDLNTVYRICRYAVSTRVLLQNSFPLLPFSTLCFIFFNLGIPEHILGPCYTCFDHVMGGRGM